MTGISSLMVGGKVTPSMTAVLAPSTESWSPIDDYYTTGTLTATPTGGTGPYTYYLEKVSGSDLSEGPLGAASFTVLSYFANPAAVRVLVTDHNGQTAYTNNCSIS